MPVRLCNSCSLVCGGRRASFHWQVHEAKLHGLASGEAAEPRLACALTGRQDVASWLHGLASGAAAEAAQERVLWALHLCLRVRVVGGFLMAARRLSASATTTHLESPALPRSATGGEGHLRRRAGAYREGSFRGASFRIRWGPWACTGIFEGLAAGPNNRWITVLHFAAPMADALEEDGLAEPTQKIRGFCRRSGQLS
jgi:hypothetical protein